MLQLAIPDKGTKDFYAIEGVTFTIAVLYTILVVGAITLLIKLRRNAQNSNQEGQSSQNLFLVFLAFQSLIRCIFFFIIASLPFVPELKDLPESLMFVLATLPFAVFYSTFVILVYIWAKMYYFGVDSTLAKRLAVGLNVSIYAALLVEYILYFLELDELNISKATVSTQSVILSLVMGFFSATLGVGFLTYGIRLIKMFRHRRDLSQGIRTIYVVTAICTICFVFRGVIMIIGYWKTLPWIFEVIYFVPSEVVPSAVMLVVFQRQPASGNENLSMNRGRYGMLINRAV